jgi:pimeloyl-ACP methyl ester carboxylesterase
MKMLRALLIGLATIVLGACSPSVMQSAAIVDPPANQEHPAANFAFTIPVGSGAMNAMLYTASGKAPHPSLLLLHGFPGNEQNLDLAQAARRAGWNVLTLHYRGTWGSAGDFSFAGAAEDARAALAFLKRPENVGRYGIDPSRIAVAGHSMGGMMAADAAAHDASIKGLFLIDPWDMSADGRAINTPAGAKAWHEDMLVDQPALSGTVEATLAAELRATVARFDLTSRLTAYGRRPLDIIGAERGGGTANAAILQAIRASANTNATGDTWPTDHSFNDRRIALAERFVAWLAKLPGGRP